MTDFPACNFNKQALLIAVVTTNLYAQIVQFRRSCSDPSLHINNSVKYKYTTSANKDDFPLME